MIATGGLLRMNRRQDSLRAKNRAENKRKRKAKKKKKNDVVVVKGKLNLCSPAGLVAAVGILVLLVGVSMAVLGYWPSQNQHEYQERRRTGAFYRSRKNHATSANVSSEKSALDHVFNASHANSDNSSVQEPAPHCGFLCDFLDSYLYSDNLKVFGPLVMGIGIFLFICANAVLHENRDKKTKIINLRDIYSTVIDLHSIRAKEYSPLNGLVNYTQARSAEGPSGSHPPSGKLTRSSWPSTGLGELGSDDVFRRPSLVERPRSWSRDVQTFTDTVYSIYKDYSNSAEQTPQPKPWDPTSIVTSSVNAFTLPVIKLNNCEVEESEKLAAADRRRSQEEVVIETAIESQSNEEDIDMSQTEETQLTDFDTSSENPNHKEDEEEVSVAVVVTSDQQQGAAHESRTQLFPSSPVKVTTGSRLSLNSLSGEREPRLVRRCSLSVSASRQSERARRFSCPKLERSNSKGYIKLADLGGESFEAPDTETSLAGGEGDVTADTKVDIEAQGEEEDKTNAAGTSSAEI
ncbi:LOW QUALITY PROTEIN: transmembrane protein 200C-like [Boleophthalmus pectinirostris]|uniref:LOW QUALITY PROTEIN: transmembrane protein 200C-like n=1 Tax=Boleophthalmus pectinirostris TaxID=150288 RepID=UPI00242C5726|nr:LOW QUALITY PROTEIN: transmembrane protein 200C-like [Boleophthalmus pectinirostris]